MYTPTHEAIRYTAKQLSRVSGKKLMILLTDGHPQYHMNGRSLDNETLVQMAIREQRKAQKIVHSMVCININAGEAVSKENLKRIFKKNYVEFNGMEQAKKFVMKNFKQAVFTALRT
jgi:Mg-chelatase subunit ChlD